jgi:hypothetical protein
VIPIKDPTDAYGFRVHAEEDPWCRRHLDFRARLCFRLNIRTLAAPCLGVNEAER